MAEIERDKPGVYHDPEDRGDDLPLAERVPDGTLAVVAYFGWLLISLSIGVALLEGGPFGVARTLFAFGVTIGFACLPLIWAKGWTD